jgi:hypothetical protein
MREPNLLAWQWSLYSKNHRHRTNLLIHIATVPLFMAGVAAVILAPITGVWWLLLAGPAVMAGVMALQGRGHRLETVAPVPFEGPADIVARILLEQLVTFPRYVLSGAFAAAWRSGR